jgi:hypothetical protein
MQEVTVRFVVVVRLTGQPICEALNRGWLLRYLFKIHTSQDTWSSMKGPTQAHHQSLIGS